MSISEISVRRPIFISMVYALLMIIAALFVSNLDIALYPSVEIPMLTIMVSADDAGPEEIEMQVTRILENSLGSLDSLEEITSQSADGRSIVMLEFAYGTDLDEAYDDVTTLLNNVERQLPSWAETPSIMRFDMSSSSTFMRLLVNGLDDEQTLKQVAENTISPLLLRIEGVSQVEVMGAGEKQIKVSINPIRLQGYNLTLTQISSALDKKNIQGKVGTITQNQIDYSVTMDERFTNLEEICTTVVAILDRVPITIADLGSVTEETNTGFHEQYLDGSSVVTLSLSNESDSNAATVAQNVRNSLELIRQELPEGGERIGSARFNYNDLLNHERSVQERNTRDSFGCICNILFLRNLKATLVISLSMPISILFTLMIMSLFDITINSMSMSGLILGIGMIVDASIIILENTYKYRESNHGSVASAILGSKNMSTAILASTITTICVFIPLFIYKNNLDMIGVMFQDLIITVCIALLSSLFVALTLVPALSGSILRIDSRVQKPLRFKPFLLIDNLYVKAESILQKEYKRGLSYFLRHRFLLIVLLVLLLLFSLQYFGGIGMNLTPQMQSDDSINLSVTLPSGSNKEATRTELFRLQKGLLEVLPEDAYSKIMVEVGTSNTGSLEISLPDITKQTYAISELKTIISPLLTENPAATWTYGGGRGPGSGDPINISVTGSDIDTKVETVNQIASIIGLYVPEATNVSTDLANGSPKITINIDEARAKELSVSMSDMYSTIATALSGTTATTISTFSTEETYDVIVSMQEDSFNTINNLGNLLVPSSLGTIRLESIATFSTSTAPATITRENKMRMNHVTASLAEGYTSDVVQEKVQLALNSFLVVPDNVVINQSGDMQQFESYGPTLVLIIALALVLVFAVMAAQFESLLDPFIIFATIPLLLIGVVFVHLIMGQSFTLFSVVGIVALIGVVVNNGIVLVDSINQIVAKNVVVMQACLDAAQTRLRPILMTTLTTVLGLFPLAFFPGEGAEIMQPIALTFIGGLITAAFLTLFLSPVLYSFFNKHREKRYFDPNSLANQITLYEKEGR